MSTKKSRFIGVAVLVAVAFIFIYIATTTDNDEWKSISYGVLASIIASFVFYMLTEFVFSDDSIDLVKKNVINLKDSADAISSQIKALSNYQDKGLERIELIESTDEENDMWLDLLSNVNMRLDIIAHTLSPWFGEKYKEKFCDCIVRTVNSGGKVRILLLDPNNLDHINTSNKSNYRMKILRSQKELANIMAKISPDMKKNLIIKLNNSFVIPYSFIRNDNSTYISPYLCYSEGRSSFIAVCKSNLELAKGFIKDFDDIFIDNNMKECNLDYMKDGKPIKTRETKGNKYQSKTWNREDTTRYVFQHNGYNSEAGFYVHYMDDIFIEKVIELSTSYGCYYKCKYCASSQITEAIPLEPQFMHEMLNSICEIKNVCQDSSFVLAMTGIGDYSVTWPRTNSFLLEAIKAYPNCKVILSSCVWSKDLVQKARELINKGVKILFLQWTYLTTDSIERFIPNYRSSDLQKTIDEIKDVLQQDNRMEKLLRINYLMIKDVNDSDEAFNLFIKKFTPIKKNILVRISKLNETSCSKANGLIPPEKSSLNRLKELCDNQGIESYVFLAEHNDNMNCGQLITDQ